MAQVFVSWGSPNENEARKVIAALRDAPFDVWDSIHGMQGGDNPYEKVIDEVGRAEVALFLLSDSVVDRPWVQQELAWCFQEYTRRGAPRIVPVRVGPLRRRPNLVEAHQQHVEDLSQLDDAAFLSLISIVRKRLGLLEPLLVPAALFAMTLEEFRKLPSAAWATVATLCQSLGMPKPLAGPTPAQNTLSLELERRYGETAEDFKPFGDATLKQIVERAQYIANASRPASEQPVLLKWCREELKRGDSDALELWGSQHSLLFVDSVSLANASLRSDLVNLPLPENRSRSAVVWIPPYTRHTAELQSNVSEAIRHVTMLTQAFNAFTSVKDTERSVTFDLFSPAALEHWLLRALGRPLRDQALASGLAAMNRYQPAPPLVPRRDFSRGQTPSP